MQIAIFFVSVRNPRKPWHRGLLPRLQQRVLRMLSARLLRRGRRGVLLALEVTPGEHSGSIATILFCILLIRLRLQRLNFVEILNH
jgi:hypothetical protein